MKKALFFLAVLCVAGIFSAKAQSPSDSSYARDLSYNFINISSLPSTASGDLASGSKILKDVRAGKRAIGYAFNVATTQTLSFWLYQSGSSDWDEYIYILDSNFNEVAHNDDYNHGSFVVTTLTRGTYYILATEFSYSNYSKPYTITIDQATLVTPSTLTYTPLGTITDISVRDTFSSSQPYLTYEDYPYIAKGYSFQGTQNNILILEDSSSSAFYLVMDNNHNVLDMGANLVTSLPQTGTYYVAVLSTAGKICKTRFRVMSSLPTYYIDGVSGDDSRNGLTPSTALATLDTAVARSGGVGKYYLTEDYTFSGNSVYVNYAQIYPYQKDIRLYMPASGSDDVILAWPGHLVFGEEGSSYYFIIDSNRNQGFDDFLDADEYGSYLEVNNLKITNSYFHSTVFWSDNLILRNCEFTNDTIGDVFIGIEEDLYNSVKLINCNISQNIFEENFMYFDYDSVKFTMENTTVVGNTFSYEYPVLFTYGSTVNIISGNWRNNRLTGDYYYNGNPNISAQNAAGIWLENSTANFGAGFTMDANNYLCIDSISTINIAGNITAPVAAQIYPCKWDNDDGHYYSNYYEGRRVLWGSTSLLANNYQKFSIAQADNSSLWYLHPDGTIHTYPVSIDQAEEGTISLYPNPANDVLNIALQGTAVNEVVVIDIYGKTVARTTVSEGSNTLDISALPAGMYFVQLRENGSVKATQKVIKR